MASSYSILHFFEDYSIQAENQWMKGKKSKSLNNFASRDNHISP